MDHLEVSGARSLASFEYEERNNFKKKMDLKACKKSRMMMDSSSSSLLSDVTSKIPDEILIDILSRLSMKEAARTSVVSHRWENL
ncbi:hypothetical protein ACH5RR_035721 [Cinchona calisaya]|uniref:F-box domain-containing protein n=1 Tax=Cinchona calisaya TaxID=153742 RepID=A0ABD2Y5W0_9GENT